MFTHKDTKDKVTGGERGARVAVQEARLGAAQLSAGGERVQKARRRDCCEVHTSSCRAQSA